jgi:hypothetical protein
MAKRSVNSDSKSLATRAYYIAEVTETEGGTTQKPAALIKTTSAAAALRYFVTPRYVVRLAEQDDIYACAEAGIKPVVPAVIPDGE